MMQFPDSSHETQFSSLGFGVNLETFKSVVVSSWFNGSFSKCTPSETFLYEITKNIEELNFIDQSVK